MTKQTSWMMGHSQVCNDKRYSTWLCVYDKGARICWNQEGPVCAGFAVKWGGGLSLYNSERHELKKRITSLKAKMTMENHFFFG